MSAANSNKPILQMTVCNLDTGSVAIVKGRRAWALDILYRRGELGATPVDAAPGHRWAAYVHKLKTEHGVDIETVREPHNGTYSGYHARYVLRSRLEVLEVVREGDKRDVAA
jgi:hypothetical protein